ncbi:MAG: UDP-N-acetylglucosamine--N-acetylmuramyl-(pentapeptide) pyrophosphoryl-undecaprenol N-acetylglucosamine transferase [Cytophagales bacterium]|nr:glycosyltransferase [Bacteroidota bacterium]MBS1981262.1 glycosyltransferase [Bacteroidota bacterium]WHZ09281.1 MAG: UDP-N-acetylglucosamine--N-acetylmuramyl-(pentapeptide) pyrophosphoryl-undecaprenol N-acetylglucosamine transferase [Cytophagales bacterium]
MNSELPNKALVTPLDWGLGHATRCVPIIYQLVKSGWEVQVASSGGALVLLRKEFSSLKFHELASYNAHYSSWLPLRLKIVFQFFKFYRAIQKEHDQIKNIVKQEKINCIISDNRYGCWSSQVKSVFIGHILNLDTPFFFKWVNAYHRELINRFSVCWIPDEESGESLSGKLSEYKPINARYIGLLSRMKWRPAKVKYDVMAILSGPEPQRSIFEILLRKELRKCGKKSLLVKGIPQQATNIQTDNLTEVDFMNSDELNQAILESEVIVCRSGYSSVMDLAVLGKKAIFVATPGQPEQEYLADELKNKRIAYSVSQKKFNLQQALNESANFTGFTQRINSDRLACAINDLIK